MSQDFKHDQHKSHKQEHHDSQDHNHHNQQGGHDDHSHHEDHDHHAHHEQMVQDFKKRFYISLFITIPILILSPMIQNFIGVDLRFNYDQYILFGLSTFIFFYGGWPFLTGGIDELKEKNPGMMTLIGLAIVVAYVYSSLTVYGLEGRNFFWELATLIDIMLLGHWIEMRSIMGASNALEELVKLMPNTAHKLDENNETEEIPVSELAVNDRVLVKPGEKVPVDGRIIDGNTSIDESMLTGESVPIEKQKEDEVIGGSVNKEGSITIEVQKVGNDSYLTQVINLVKEAQASKSKAQDFTDRAAKWLFYIAISAGLVTLAVWLALGYSFDVALERMVTVMVITCPHALGLASPLVVAVSTALSAKQGLLIRNRVNFENARQIDTVVFDKTGTLTKGEFGVTDVIPNDTNEDDLLKLAASVEYKSEHPIAKGIVNSAEEKNLTLKDVQDFNSNTGEGIEGKIDGQHIKIVSPKYIEKNNIDIDRDTFNHLSEQGKTVVFVLSNEKLLGMVALADMIKDEAKEAVQLLKDNGIKSVMLTGDHQKVADWVAKEIGIEEVHAEVLPDHKAEHIKEIQKKQAKVAMTGDGINDAPALATADLGIAIGAGTDVAMETADVVLVQSNPKDVVSLVELSRKTYRKMVQNLWWASGYNIIAIPLAAGVLAPIGIVLSPAVGAMLMSLSTVIVAINAKLLKA
ncbi:heavy metal translocating P-type ATPase [Piscibacillus salipiscarius]|uniref:P-type Cu(+) transporter n=1 Tax=Piscibacillus salipiscarius TaxID=299480 RepID=A0ABW5Q5P9_9BACI